MLQVSVWWKWMIYSLLLDSWVYFYACALFPFPCIPMKFIFKDLPNFGDEKCYWKIFFKNRLLNTVSKLFEWNNFFRVDFKEIVIPKLRVFWKQLNVINVILCCPNSIYWRNLRVRFFTLIDAYSCPSLEHAYWCDVCTSWVYQQCSHFSYYCW